MTSRTAVRIIITGRVQGVWFRAWTVREARARGLDGWVRNRLDGTVEALFSGPADAVREMIAACREGPEAARVSGLQTEPVDEAVPPGFSPRRTA